jgi:4-alpha-glucanotransferase
MAINLEYCNLLRIDHFRALSAFWEIPAGESTAINGWWSLGPGYHFLSVMKEYFPEMPFIVEDLGDIDQEVYKLRDAYNLPGMRVLQFAFDNKPSRSLHAPHMYHPHSIVYTGTHDNNTILGWYGTDNSNNKIRQQLKDYTGKAIAEQNVVWEMVRMAWSSVAKIAIIPMQDILGLGPEARLNTPSTTTGNWKWKLQNSDLNRSTYTFKKLSCQYGRI